MLDLLGMISALERPRLLVRTARFGLGGYDRARCLSRLIDAPGPLRTGEIILRLIEAEATQEDLRLARVAAYKPRRHLEVLIALLAEARTLRESLRPRLVA
jgi:hypothetical protein